MSSVVLEHTIGGFKNFPTDPMTVNPAVTSLCHSLQFTDMGLTLTLTCRPSFGRIAVDPVPAAMCNDS